VKRKSTSHPPLIIAIDGPAASGKGTLARQIAAHYGLAHLDTGLTYRGVAQQMLREGKNLDDETAALAIAQKLDLSQLDKDSLALSAHEIGEAASKIAVFACLRQALVAAQRTFALSQISGVVLDGRDIGTVVMPDATIKFYVTATVQARAKRRAQEIIARGGQADLDNILVDIARRDARDMARKEGALKQAQDAHLLDTTKLTIEAAFLAACHFIDERQMRGMRESPKPEI